jgi:hypothetical protein
MGLFAQSALYANRERVFALSKDRKGHTTPPPWANMNKREGLRGGDDYLGTDERKGTSHDTQDREAPAAVRSAP